MLTFYKMEGSGNDFILMDNRVLKLPLEKIPSLAEKLCRRAVGIGADGLILIGDSKKKSNAYQFHFYNADGSRGEMCGNGARCVAWLAVYLDIADSSHQFQSDAGDVPVKTDFAGERVNVRLTSPKHLKLNIKCRIGKVDYNVHFVNTGVPHAVIFVNDLDAVNVTEIGSALRHHHLFAPLGTNVNFVKIIDKAHCRIRTYERGVEAETLACGTGSSAAAFIAYKLGLMNASVKVTPKSAEHLLIDYKDSYLWLDGPVRLVYKGEISSDAHYRHPAT